MVDENYLQDRIFLAYKGEEFTNEYILDNVRYYKDRADDDYAKLDNVIIAAAVPKDLKGIYPFTMPNSQIISMGAFNKTEAKNSDGGNVKEIYQDFYTIPCYTYIHEHEDMFNTLSQRMHFSNVIWDGSIGSFVAGVTDPGPNEEVHLYYGYTKFKHELMISNYRPLLKPFCNDIFEFEPNTYMKNNKFYTFDGVEIKDINEPLVDQQADAEVTSESKPVDFIPNSNENVNAFLAGLNQLLNSISTESIKEKVTACVKKYLESKETKERLKGLVDQQITDETIKRVYDIVHEIIVKYSLEDEMVVKLDKLFESKYKQFAKSAKVPIVNIIKLNDIVHGQTDAGFYHEKFEEILSLVQLDEPVMLIGPAGSGKNYAISQIANALGHKMYYTNNASNEFKLTGFIDAGGHYRETEFYKAFKNGGVFFLDEIDTSDPSALIVINSALANGYMAFPHETIDKHPNFRMVAAANTWGKGADLQYIGRNALDSATLDRFDNVFFDYDRKLEASLYPSKEVLDFMWAFRDACMEAELPHIISTRGIGKVYKKEINNIPIDVILKTNVVRNLSSDDLTIILHRMYSSNNEIDINNYYKRAKVLVPNFSNEPEELPF